MSLFKFLAKHAEELSPMALEWAKKNKKALAIAGGVGAAGAAGMAAQPAIDDFMTDQAINSMIRNGKRAATDAVDYAEKHPYASAAILGGAGLGGARLGEQNFSDLFNTLSPVKLPQRRR